MGPVYDWCENVPLFHQTMGLLQPIIGNGDIRYQTSSFDLIDFACNDGDFHYSRELTMDITFVTMSFMIKLLSTLG